MRRLLFPGFALLVLLVPLAALAQPPAGEEEEAEGTDDSATDDSATDDSATDEGSAEGEGTPDGDEDSEEESLRPPSFEPIAMQDPEEEVEGSADEEAEEGEGILSPEEAARELSELGPWASDAAGEPTSPVIPLTLHGYFRVRSELWDSFWLGRDETVDFPFSRFRPIERPAPGGGVPTGGCSDDPAADTAGCDGSTLGFANMRLRLEPTLELSDDVRVHMQLDVFDNLVLGSTPGGLVDGMGAESPIDSLASTAAPPSSQRNTLTDAITARRAWAEIRSPGLGELRFGRMPSHWGLGILHNGGDGIDSDFQTDVDRIQATVNLFGFYVSAAWDFMHEGFVQQNYDPLALPYDAGQEDDIDQFAFTIAHRMDPDDQRDAIQRGEWVLNGGVYLLYRDQLLSSQEVTDRFGAAPPVTSLMRRDVEMWAPDGWIQFLYRGLRLELEASVNIGSIENINLAGEPPESVDLLQFGAALETEYRLLDDQLGVYFYTGYASGDQDVDGLTVGENLLGERNDDVTTFWFHPNYRIDLILWRNIMTQVSGAYYFRPGVSYDFIRGAFGQLFGIRADVVYSRASRKAQAYGLDSDLGVELDASLYYRSEDGPDLLDGFHAKLQYGILFPLAGLRVRDNLSDELENAQTLRLILGASF